MEGYNEIILCKKEMINAMQYYFDNVLLKDNKYEITDIVYMSNGEYAYSFKIKLKGENVE